MAGTGLLLVVGALFGIGLAVSFAAGWQEWRDSYVVLPVVLVVIWRLHRVGLYIGDQGVRIRHVLRTRTLPWDDISRFETRPATLLGSTTRQPAIWVISPGQAVETPVRQQAHRWTSDLMRRDLSPATYEQTMRTLQGRTLDHDRRR
jgi:hypothetical protein